MIQKRHHYKNDNDWLSKFFTGIFVLYSLYLLLLYVSNPAEFWRWVIYSILFIVVITSLVIIFGIYRRHLIQNHLDKILLKLRNAGQEEYVNNFINRFGLENTKENGYSFRNHKFDWDRINDLKKILKENGVSSQDKDTFSILRYLIQEKEEHLTRESILKEPQKFTDLSTSGSDFEKLLCRLFEAMGYKVELTGKSGDQGGDLIANKNGERVLIQAKSYRDWSTGNAAVQQVVGAMKYYDCNKSMVFTTSHFTPEAITLAKTNNTELVSKEQLKEILLKYLGESWF